MKFPFFLTEMDKNSVRAVLFLFFMFLLVLVIIFVGRHYLNLDNQDLAQWLDGFSHSPWGVLVVIVTYVGCALIGVPQWALFAATFVTFGSRFGAIYAWVATLTSASFTFYFGRALGAERLTAIGGDIVKRIMVLVRRNGFLMSLAVRLVPTGPFILVNMAAGVSGMRYFAFLAGTALGIIPKIAIVGLIAQGILSGAQGDYLKSGVIVIALIFIVIMLLVRRKLRSVILSDAKNDQEGTVSQ